jgi:elongation factor P--(R)-beta-lysine ligase
MSAEDWQPTASRAALRLRAALYACVRDYFAERGVLEVETPMLSQAGNTDPNIRSFQTRFHGSERGGEATRWLRTSPEFALKRLLASGLGDCYELGRVFRDGEAGARHNPEFTMLEWYRVDWDHHRLMDEVAELVTLALALVDLPLAAIRVTYRGLYREAFGFDPFTASLSELQRPLHAVRIDGEGLERDDWLDLLMTHRLQPAFDPRRLLFVYDYPASQCALARIRGQGEDAVAERFEAYLGPLELANGYHELRNADEQSARFARDLDRRRARHDAVPAVDARLLGALHSGLPECAGVALGIDRLLMAMAGSENVADVLALPFSRA